MSDYKYKFDKLSELMDELDNVIADLIAKRKEILSKIDDDIIRLAKPESKGLYITKNGQAYKLLPVYEEDQNKTTSFTTFVNKFTYDLLNEIVKRYGENVSKFLKNRYFYNFINDADYASKFAHDYALIQNEIGSKLEIKDANDRSSMALALKYFDTKRLKKAAKVLDVTPGNIIRHLIHMAVYEELVTKKIQDVYVPSDINIVYVKCKSTNVKAYGYDPKTSCLYIQFVSGAKYKYIDVPEHIYNDMLKAGSKGEFVNEVIKTSNFKYVQIDR